jgi:MIP family channel proteins
MLAKALVSEFVGTFAICFVALAVKANLGEVPGGLLGIALANGLVVACFATAAGPISGGHFNPAVTIGFWVVRKIDHLKASAFILSQLLGATAGAFLASASFTNDPFVAANGLSAVGLGSTVGAAFVAEIVATFMLMWVIFGTAVDPRRAVSGAMYIGLVVAVGILSVGPISSGAMNPARWFGPAVVTGDFSALTLFVGGPIAGAILASVVYSWFLKEDANKKPEAIE